MVLELFMASSLLITFPSEKAHLPAVTNTYCIGACPTDAAALTINNMPVPIYHTGAFLAMVGVRPGVNRLVARCGTQEVVRTFSVAAKAPPAPKKVSPPRNPYADLKIPTNMPVRVRPVGKRPQDVFVLVDPGHGGRDTGALSPHGWCEKDANLLQARAVRNELARAGFRVALTRNDDSFPLLYDRPRRAIRDQADLFISIHHNATACSRNPREARHTVVYASNTNGLALASAIQKQLGAVMAPVTNAGAQMMSLAVCRNPIVPSCLVEVDFINLPEGEEDSWNPIRHQRVARAVTYGVLDWLMTP